MEEKGNKQGKKNKQIGCEVIIRLKSLASHLICKSYMRPTSSNGIFLKKFPYGRPYLHSGGLQLSCNPCLFWFSNNCQDINN